MSEWDPEAAGNAAIYLRLPDIQMLEIRNAPFTGGNQVWVPYADTGYTKAVIEDNQDGVPNGEIKVKRTVDMKARVSLTLKSPHCIELVYLMDASVKP